MAAIDKTYVNNWEDYCKIIDWCKNNSFTCPNGTIIRFYPYKWEKHNFKDGWERPILNTSYTEDYFLIKYCPIKVIQDRMKEVYDEEEYNSILNGTSEFDKFVRPTKVNHIKLIKKPHYYRPAKYFSRYSKKWILDKYTVDIDLPGEWGKYPSYNENDQQWLLPNELGIGTISSPDLKCKSWKALIRKIRSWYLPKGTIIRIGYLRFYREECKFIVK